MTSINSVSGSGYNPAQYSEKTGVAGQAAKKAHHHHGGGHKAAAPSAATATDPATSAWSTPATTPATGANAIKPATGSTTAKESTKADKGAMASVDGWPSGGGSTFDVMA